MASRYHCVGGVWTPDKRVEKDGDSFTSEEVDYVTVHDISVCVVFKDKSRKPICPDYTGHGSKEDAISEAKQWAKVIPTIYKETELDTRTPETRYVLTLTPDQAHVLCRACELYTRLHIGQLNELPMELMDLTRKDFCERRDAAEPLLYQLKHLFFPELSPLQGASYGVGHDLQSDRAWDLYQVVRYAMAWHEHPEGGITVNFNKPYSAANEPLATCEVKT